MNLAYSALLPVGFPPLARTWVYQSSRLFTLSEALEIEDRLAAFVKDWQSHGITVKGYGNLFFGRFIVLMADETQTGVSGCSTDSSVHFIKEIESQLAVNLFDRQLLAFLVKDCIEIIPLAQANHAAENGLITPQTIFFDNTVQTKEELTHNWLIPVKDSWLAKRISFPQDLANA